MEILRLLFRERLSAKVCCYGQNLKLAKSQRSRNKSGLLTQKTECSAIQRCNTNGTNSKYAKLLFNKTRGKMSMKNFRLWVRDPILGGFVRARD